MYTKKMVLVHTETIIGLDCPPVSRIILPYIEQDHRKTRFVSLNTLNLLITLVFIYDYKKSLIILPHCRTFSNSYPDAPSLVMQFAKCLFPGHQLISLMLFSQVKPFIVN